MSALFEGLAFGGEWRRYQRAALAAFDRDVAEGRARTHIVAPPGSGKTLLGVELIRRLGRRALVLAPTPAVQLQWPRAVRQFARDAGAVAGADPSRPIACLAYQDLTELEDPGIADARAEDADGADGLETWLSASARARVRALGGVRVVVFDECHHLAGPWGGLIARIVRELPAVEHVIGLTATPPASLAGEGAETYTELLGPVDVTVLTPAVVRDGHLTPYQELVWLTEPVPAEHAWLAQREAALAEAGEAAGRDRTRRLEQDALRLLAGSAAKAPALVEIAAAEAAVRGSELRALVLCDAEAAAQRPEDALAGVLDPAALTARHVVLALAGDARTAPLRPLLVSERGLLCAPGDAEPLLGALEAEAAVRFALPEWVAEPDGVLVVLRSSGAEWMPRAWVDLATRVLVAGTTRALVGTRGLLGEGWECARLNVLCDLTVAPHGPSVQQVHGLALRPDPALSGKVAANWEVVCAAPGLARGGADHARWAARQAALFALADDGAVEAGAGHAHPDLGTPLDFPGAGFAALDAAQLARAGDLDGAREAWRVGGGYRGLELPTLLVRGPDGKDALDLEAAARALAAAYAELGELRDAAGAEVRVSDRAGGWRRVVLPAAAPAEAQRVVGALAAVLGAAEAPALLVSRPLGGARRGPLGRLRRGSGGPEALHPVPGDLAHDPARADVLLRAWRRHVGPGRLLEAAAGAPVGGYTTAVRAVWV